MGDVLAACAPRAHRPRGTFVSSFRPAVAGRPPPLGPEGSDIRLVPTTICCHSEWNRLAPRVGVNLGA